MHRVDVFWSYRSPFSYLAIPDILALPGLFEIEVVFRPVYPLAIRHPEMFGPDRRPWSDYIQMDWKRRAEFLGLAHANPDPDPIVIDPGEFRPAAKQPYIHWLTELGVEAARRGRGAEFAAEMSRLIFGGTRDWDKGDHLALAAERSGLDLAEMRKATAGGDHAREIEANGLALSAAGHWGVPTFVFEGEPFFGQDRVETLHWRLDQKGIARRMK